MGRLSETALKCIRGAILGAYLLTVAAGGGVHWDRMVADAGGSTHRLCLYLHPLEHDGLTHQCPDDPAPQRVIPNQQVPVEGAVSAIPHSVAQVSTCLILSPCVQQVPAPAKVPSSLNIPRTRVAWSGYEPALIDGLHYELSGRSPPLS